MLRFSFYLQTRRFTSHWNVFLKWRSRDDEKEATWAGTEQHAVAYLGPQGCKRLQEDGLENHQGPEKMAAFYWDLNQVLVLFVVGKKETSDDLNKQKLVSKYHL